MKLNLGCGIKKFPGFVNIDGKADVEPDLLMDITDISSKFNDVDLIYAAHVFEHFPHKKSELNLKTCHEVLYDWHKALKKGGTLRLSIPDFEQVCKYYIFTGDIMPLRTSLNGGQKHIFDLHYSCWDFKSLKSILEECGFTNVRRYDWRKTEHFYIDDYSQAYLPHMDKMNGFQISLNVEANKL